MKTEAESLHKEGWIRSMGRQTARFFCTTDYEVQVMCCVVAFLGPICAYKSELALSQAENATFN